MDNETLRLEVRDEVGGERPKRLRKDGYIPAIVYGHEMESVPAQIKESDLRRFLSSRGKNSVFTTEFAAEHDFCGLIKDIRYDPFGNSITHVDIQRVSLDEKIHASVPIKTVGKEKLDRTKSVIVHQLNEVTIECFPSDVPAFIEADISGMKIGNSLTASQLKLPQGAKLVTAPGDVVLSITTGRLDLKVSKADEPVVPQGEEGKLEAKRA